MKSRTAIIVMVLAAMGTGSTSFAQDYRPRLQDRNQPRFEQRDRHPGSTGNQQLQRGEPRPLQYDARNDYRGGAKHGPQTRNGYDQGRRGFEPRGHGPVHGPIYYSSGARGPQFRPGLAIPVQYRGYNHVVNNWHAHHLHAPQYGQQWVQVGADYALIAIATGVILHLVLSQ